MDVDEVYLYSQLPSPRHIRILVVDAAVSHDAPLMCHICDESLDDSPSYEALSYVWGSSDKPCSVSIGSENRGLTITASLDVALRRFREHDEPRRLWIDAVCINQEDIEERSQQVNLMTCIYQQASAVLIWLGEEDETTKLAFQLLWDIDALLSITWEFTAAVYIRVFLTMLLWPLHSLVFWAFPTSQHQLLSQIGRRCLQTLQRICRLGMFHIGDILCRSVLEHWNLGVEYRARLMLDAMTDNPIKIPQGGTPAWKALEKLLDRPWFYRAWILQEAIVCKRNRIFCGPYELQWDVFYRSILVMHSFAFSNSLMGGKELLAFTILMVRDVFHGNTQSQIDISGADRLLDFETLMASSRNRFATDPRDKVFSVFGIAKNCPSELKPDYSLSVKELYIQVTKLLLDEDLNVLSRSYWNGEDGTIPSWVVDWNTRHMGWPLIGDEFHTSPLPTEITLYGDRMMLKGFVKGTIKSLNRNFEEFITSETESSPEERALFQGTLSDRIMELEPFSTVENIHTTVGESFMQALGRTLMLDLFDQKRLSVDDFKRWQPNITEWLLTPFDSFETDTRVLGFSRSASIDVITLHTFGREISGMMDNISRNLRDYEICVTEEGYLAMVPDGAREGDLVCILKGAETPFILRRDDSEFLLIGSCYVHGIMDGEAMADTLEEGFQYQEFILK